MKDLEVNKIAAAIFMAGLIALVSGKVADTLYHPVEAPEKRGFAVEVAESTTETGVAPVAEAPIDVVALMAAADAAAGATTFKKCASCHSTEPGKNTVGPSLAGIVGAKKAAHGEFAYSEALKAKGGTWDYADLFEFLKSPKTYAPGTKMSFAGLKDPKERANVIAFLKSK
jgi:cytochrome c